MKTEDFSANPQINDLRTSIDNIDASIIFLLAERFRCTRKIGAVKASERLAPVDPEREEKQITRLRQIARIAEFDGDFAETFYRTVSAEVVRQHISAAQRP
jgi:chorismate mutase